MPRGAYGSRGGRGGGRGARGLRSGAMTTSRADALRERLHGTPTVGVIGLGYVGLPLAVAFAASGARVIGVDVETRRIQAVAAGSTYVEDVSGEELRRLVRGGRLPAPEQGGAARQA